MKSESKNVRVGFFRRLFEKRHFDKAGAMAFFVIFTTVYGAVGFFALGVWGLGWLVNRHPEVLFEIVGAVGFGLLLLIFFNGAFPKENEANEEDAGAAEEKPGRIRRALEWWFSWMEP